MTDWITRYSTIDGRLLGRRPCWEMVRRVYAEHGVALPEHGEISAADLVACATAIEAAKAAGPWTKIATGAERPLDVVAINRVVGGKLRSAHVGIVTRPGHILHAEEGCGVLHLAFRDGPTFRADPSLRFMVDSIWRHRAFAEAMAA